MVDHIEIALAGGGLDLDYWAGDALGVLPADCGAEVAAILAATGFAGVGRVALRTGLTTLRAALLSRLDQATSTAATLDAWQAEAEPGIRLIDVLAEALRSMTLQTLVDWLRTLQPWPYSIAPGPAAHPGEVNVTLGEVRYTLPSARKGYASTCLGNRLTAGSSVGVFLYRSERFHFSADDMPVMMCP